MKHPLVFKILVWLPIILLLSDPIFVHSMPLARGVIALAVILLFISMVYVYRASSKNEITNSKAWGIVVVDILALFLGAVLLFVTFWSENPGPM